MRIFIPTLKPCEVLSCNDFARETETLCSECRHKYFSPDYSVIFCTRCGKIISFCWREDNSLPFRLKFQFILCKGCIIDLETNILNYYKS